MKPVLISFAALALTACAESDAIVFATNTEIGIGADASLGSASIGLDRSEIIVTPSSQQGDVPAIYAELQSNRSLTQPEIIQNFATGDAAALVTAPTDPSGAGATVDQNYKRDKRRMLIFGTTTNLGFKVAAGTNSVPVFSLGYKRKEASRIPIQPYTDDAKPTKMPSLFAHLRISASQGKVAKKETQGDLGNATTANTNIATAIPFDLSSGQMIATGAAADNLTRNKAIRSAVSRKVTQAAAGGLSCEGFSDNASKQDCKVDASKREEALEQ